MIASVVFDISAMTRLTIIVYPAIEVTSVCCVIDLSQNLN